MKIISIVGARPEFIQASPVSQALRRHHHEILVHTGQHYDYQMSQAFFSELGIPVPDYNLEVGSDSHARQTAKILMSLDEVYQKEKPDLVIVRGDTNSTLAGGLAASKLNIPVAHIEAGERSYNRKMPEEINRLVVDAVSDLHFCSSRSAVGHLKLEGITSSVHWVGDVMYDAMLQNRPVAEGKSRIIETLKSKSETLRPGHDPPLGEYRRSSKPGQNRRNSQPGRRDRCISSPPPHAPGFSAPEYLLSRVDSSD